MARLCPRFIPIHSSERIPESVLESQWSRHGVRVRRWPVSFLAGWWIPMCRVGTRCGGYNNSIYGLLENTSTFWSEVKRYRDSAGNPYEDVVNFALSLLSLPWSNAEVERDFSQVNLVKTKIRNRLEVDTLNAILAIRFGLRHHKLCCHNYNLPEKYLQLIGSMATYEDSNDDDGKIIEDALKLLS
nr:uncharacterized protein LOC108072286 [Drosophila kikkawai]